MKKNWKSNFVIVLCFALFILPFSNSISAQPLEQIANKNETTEEFVIETFDYENDLFVVNGSKHVIANTIISSQNGFPTETIVETVEDYYDTSNNFLFSQIKYEKFQNDYDTGKAQLTKKELKYEEPKVSDGIYPSKTSLTDNKVLSSTQKINIKNKIKSQIESLKEETTEEIQGFTKAQFSELKNGAQAAINQEKMNRALKPSLSNGIVPLDHYENCPVVSQGVERCGAYNNYYNFTLSSSAFTIQTLTYDPEGNIYNRIVGNTYGNSQLASLIGEYKTIINLYDKFSQRDMDGAHWSEVVGWASALASMVLLVVGWASGPPGWVAIATNYGGALALLAGLTSTGYATAQRLSYSGTAAAYLHNANQKHAQIVNSGLAGKGQYLKIYLQ